MKDRQYRAPSPGHKSHDKSHMLPKFLNLRIKQKKKDYSLGRTNKLVPKKETQDGGGHRLAVTSEQPEC